MALGRLTLDSVKRHVIAQALQAVDQRRDRTVAPPAIKMRGSSILGDHPLLQHVLGRH
jgi:hypothetical protein